MATPDIPITVIGGYLGAGKTTLINRLLAEPGSRRLGVIVNDFGSIGIDAELLARANDSGIVNLPNGCICCSLGNDLMTSLTALRETEPPPDHIVIEASGIADPAVAAGWGTSVGFAPGGVIVLAAADVIQRLVDDRYVSAEVRRQLAGADLIVVTKIDLCESGQLEHARAVIDRHAGAAPTVDADVPIDVLLGVEPSPPDVQRDDVEPSSHSTGYLRWSWSADEVIDARVDDLADSLASVLRLKAVLDVGSAHRVLHVVGGRLSEQRVIGLRPGSRAEAVLLAGTTSGDALTEIFDRLHE